jgi:hypothetical protein
MIGGMAIIEVQPGTEIEHKGEKMTVTDTNAVTLGRKIYVTPSVYIRLRERAILLKKDRT